MSGTNGELQSGNGAAFWAARGVRIEPEPELEPETEPGLEAEFEDAAELAEAAESGDAVDSEDAVFEDAVSEDPVPDVVDAFTADEDTDAAAKTDTGADTAVVIPAQSQASLDEIDPQDGELVDGLAVLSESLAETRRARENAPRPEPAWQLSNELATPLPPLKTCLEAILMVVDEPVTAVVLAQVVERPTGEVGEALRELAEEYTVQGRGFELREVGVSLGHGGQTGWRMYSRAECAPVVERFVRDGQQAKLTQAALETLAVVAYRQPVSRSKVSAIRGVNCDGVMRTLLARGLVEECGTEHETGALLYQTTGYFLERMGLKGLDELPELAPLLPSAAEVEDEA
jgi:segregation and condensation protein B